MTAVSEDIWRQVNGVIWIIVGVMLWRQLYWQWFLGIRDRQKKSAALLVIVFSATLIQVGLASASITPPLNTGPRGTITGIALLVSVAWWVLATELHNRKALGKRPRYPGDSGTIEDDPPPAP